MSAAAPLYQHVAANASPANGMRTATACWWSVRLSRKNWRRSAPLVGDMPLLVPGVGAQGGDVAAVGATARTADGTGLIVSSSRAILYASRGEDYAEAAARAARALRDEINRHR